MVEIEISRLKSIAELIALVVLLYGYFAKVARFADKQKKINDEIKEMKEEQSILTYGVLACLKGLKERGCN